MRKVTAVLAAMAVLLAVLPPAAAATTSPAQRTYTTSSDFDAGALVGVEDKTVPDQLQLSKAVTTLPFIWVPNNNGTVSKVHTETGKELGRYFVTPPGLPAAGSPSRTTVDLEGNVWVGNRQAGTVVKIGLLEAGQCVDRNRNGTIETARDTNADGVVTDAEVLPWGSDECVLNEVVLVSGREGPHVPGTYTGPYDTEYWGVSPRSLAVDGRNNLWAGTGSTQKFYYIDGATGNILNVVDVSQWNHQAYGATIDRSGVLWSLRPLLRIDPAALGSGMTGLAAATLSKGAAGGQNNPYTATPRTVTPPAGRALGAPVLPPVLPVTPKAGRTKPAGERPLSPFVKSMEMLTTGAGDVVNFASFGTAYTYEAQVDAVGNVPAEMRTEVRANAGCPPESAQALTLDLQSAYPVSNTWSSGAPVSPPAGTDYRWTFPARPDGCGGYAGGQTDLKATLLTGLAVSRAVDRRQFSGAGPFMQTLTVSATAADAFRDLRVNGRADVGGLDATIQSVSGGSFNLSPDGRSFDLWVNNPTPGQAYTWQITISIGALPAGYQALDYVPDLWAAGFVTVAQADSAGSSVTGPSPDQAGAALATWSWQSNGEYGWHWEQEVVKQIHLSGAIKDPLAPEAQVWAGLETLYSYESPADSVDNSAVKMQAGVNTNLFNFPDGSGLAVVSPILDLSSASAIRYTNASGQPLPPPAGVQYRWGFPDLPEGASGWANGQADQIAMLAPGFTASRDANQRTFTGPGSQTVSLRVTPTEPIDRLQIQGRTDIDGFAALLRSVSGPNVNLHPDGRSFDAWIEAPVVGQTYVWTIETELSALPAGFQALNYMPDLWVQNMDTVAEGTHDGSSLVRQTEFVTWAWQATGNYRWHWQQRLGKQAHLQGMLTDPLAPSVQVWTNFQTAYSYFTADDSVANPAAALKAEVHSQVNVPPDSAAPVVDPTLDLSSPFTFEGVWSSGQQVSAPEGVAYRWQFPTLGAGAGANAGGRTDQSATLATGVSASRTVDQRRFTGPGTQVLRITAVPQEVMAALAVNGSVNIDGLDAVVSAVSGPSINSFPDGSGFGAWVENPVVGQPYQWDVTITIRSLPAGYRSLEFMPRVSVENVQRERLGTTDGDHLTMPATNLDGQPLATWTWRAAGNYRWHWQDNLSKRVDMQGYITDPEAPIRNVPLNAGTYALAPDYLGNLFVTGYDQNTLSKLDTATGKVIFVKNTPPGCARGVAITTDNHVWVADTCRNSVLHFDNDGNLLAEVAGLKGPSGVAVDAAGKVWATDMNSERIYRIDPAANAIDLTLELPGSGGHYSYSDMTGMVSRTISTTTGTWTALHDSGRAGAPWGTVDWNSKVPAGTTLTVRVRSSEDQVAWSAWETVQSGVSLTQTPGGRYLQIEVAFRIVAGDESPVLYDLTVTPAKPAGITVPVDIKPTSCPNPLNWTDKGVLPAAVLGTADFDVARINPDSVRLAGVAPLRWTVEDVAAPYAGAITDPPDRMSCTTAGPDGLADLTFRFDAQAVIAALGDRADGDVVVLQLTGQLRDGTPFTGEDVVVIIRRKQ